MWLSSYFRTNYLKGFPVSSAGKESTCNAGDPGSIPGLRRSAGEDLPTPVFLGFPWGSAGKEYTCNAGDLGLIPSLGRSPGKGKGYPLQYSGLENSMNCIVHGVLKFWFWWNTTFPSSFITCAFQVKLKYSLTSLGVSDLFLCRPLFIVSHVIIQLPHYWLFKRAFFPLLDCLDFFVKDQLTINVRISFRTLKANPLIYVFLYAGITLSWLLCHCRNFWNQKVYVLQLCSF